MSLSEPDAGLGVFASAVADPAVITDIADSGPATIRIGIDPPLRMEVVTAAGVQIAPEEVFALDRLTLRSDAADRELLDDCRRRSWPLRVVADLDLDRSTIRNVTISETLRGA